MTQCREEVLVPGSGDREPAGAEDAAQDGKIVTGAEKRLNGIH
jgi:hypothetical protein